MSDLPPSLEAADLPTGGAQPLAWPQRYPLLADTIGAALRHGVAWPLLVRQLAETLGDSLGCQRVLAYVNLAATLTDPATLCITWSPQHGLQQASSLELQISRRFASQLLAHEPIQLFEPDRQQYWAVAPALCRIELQALIALPIEQEISLSAAEQLALRQAADLLALVVGYSRLAAHTDLNTEQQLALARVARACNSWLSLDTVLPYILDQLHFFVHYDAATIILLRADGLGQVLASRGFPAAVNVDKVLLDTSPGTLSYRLLYQEQEAILVPDMREAAGWQDVPGSNLTRSWIGVRLMADGELLGWMAIDHWQPYAFSQADVRIAVALAEHVATAMRNARAHEAALRRARQLQLVHRLSLRIGAQRSIPALAEELVREVQVTFGYYYVGLWLTDQQSLVFYSLRGNQSGSITFVALDQGQGLSGWVARTGKSALVGDVRHDPRYLAAPQAPATLSELVVPLHGTQGLLGVLNLESDRLYDFSQEDQELMEALAAQTALALENIRRYEEVNRQRRRLEVLQETVAVLDAALDVNAIEALLVERILLIFDASAAAVFGPDQQHNWVVRVGYGLSERFLARRAIAAVNRAEFRELRQAGPYILNYATSLSQTEPLEQQQLVVDERLQWALIVPIMVDGVEATSLAVFRHHGAQPFDQQELNLARLLAHQLTITIKNTRLFTNLRAAYDELSRTQAHMLRSERLRSLGELASGVAHDFNNLLSGILGHTQLLLYDIENEQFRAQLKVIERAALDGAATVRRLQDFARIVPRDTFELVDLNTLADESLAITRPRWRDDVQRAGELITVGREYTPLPPVSGNPSALRELVTNLLMNALDAMPKGGTLTLRTRCEQKLAANSEWVVLEVEDTGVGIPLELQERIFDPFFTTKGTRGTGMGLAVVQGLLSQHQGTISVQSVAGQGSTFTVRLPSAQLQQTRESRVQTPLRLQPWRVLLIEDEAPVRSMLAGLLERAGLAVQACESGAEALAVFEPGRFELVCTDLGMPGMSGWDVLAELREREPRLPTLLITGWGNQISSQDALHLGADLVLAKPFEASQLYEAIALLQQRYCPGESV